MALLVLILILLGKQIQNGLRISQLLKKCQLMGGRVIVGAKKKIKVLHVWQGAKRISFNGDAFAERKCI